MTTTSLNITRSYVSAIVNQTRGNKALQAELIGALLDDKGVLPYDERITSPSGRNYDISPFRKIGAGATAVVLLHDEDQGETYVLAGRKHASSGLDGYVLPGGYINGQPVKQASEAEFKRADKNLEATARREVFEETGLKLDAHVRATPLGTDSDMGQNRNQQSVNEFFLYELKGNPDTVAMQGGQDDLQHAEWVNIKDTLKNPDLPPQLETSGQSRYAIAHENGTITQFHDLHASYVEKALELVQARDAQPNWQSRIMQDYEQAAAAQQTR